MTSDIPDHLLKRFAEGSTRVEMFEHDGKRIWVKRPEHLSWRMRLQKGDPVAAFQQEVAAHLELQEIGAPVPRIVARDETFMATADCGHDLRRFMRYPPEKTVLNAIMSKAGGALGRLHASGLVHGRPAINDICWDDETITFIDFERMLRTDQDETGKAKDLVIFIMSLFSYGASSELVANAHAGYDAESPGVSAKARKILLRRRWLPLVLKPLMPLLKRKREFVAIGATYDHFLG